MTSFFLTSFFLTSLGDGVTNVLGFGLAVGLGMVHILAGRSHGLSRLPQERWASFAGGISIAYVFLNVFPELSQAQADIEDWENWLVVYFENHVYLLSLIGLSLFYGLEKLAVRSRDHNRKMHGKNETEPNVFWFHIIFFAMYNAILGYLFRASAIHGITDCALLFFALGLHFVVNDVALREHHQRAYNRFGRWILAVAIVAGWSKVLAASSV
ncbi:MAG: hypothetical protein WA949_13940 [Phormidesmis sp.]